MEILENIHNDFQKVFEEENPTNRIEVVGFQIYSSFLKILDSLLSLYIENLVKMKKKNINSLFFIIL